MKPDLPMRALLDCANAMADAAGAAIRPHFRTRLLADNKDAQGGFDPVTVADRAAEDAMRAVLAQMRPEDAILGEERGFAGGESGLTWVLDPIDGTRAFLCGAPTWGVLIALHDGGAPFLGVLDQPHTGERFIATPGHAMLRHQGVELTLRTRATRTLEDAILMTTFPEVGTQAERAAFNKVRDQVKLTRYGLDCYAYALLALGQVDLVIEAGLQAYDIQAPMAIVEGAGGIVTNWEGGPAQNGGRAIAAANPEVHAAALAVLAG